MIFDAARTLSGLRRSTAMEKAFEHIEDSQLRTIEGAPAFVMETQRSIARPGR